MQKLPLPDDHPIAVNALRTKRAQLAGEIEMHSREIDRLRAELVHVDGTLRLFDPGTDPDEVGSVRVYPRRTEWFAAGEIRRRIYDTLRRQETAWPVEIARTAMAEKVSRHSTRQRCGTSSPASSMLAATSQSAPPGKDWPRGTARDGSSRTERTATRHWLNGIQRSVNSLRLADPVVSCSLDRKGWYPERPEIMAARHRLAETRWPKKWKAADHGLAEMDYQIVLGGAALLVSGYGVHHTRRQTKMMEASLQPRAARRRGDIPKKASWWNPAYPVLAILIVLAWVPWALKAFSDKPLTPVQWGPVSSRIDVISRKVISITLAVTVNGEELSYYSTGYRVMGIAFHNYGDKDIDDIDDIQKSNLYDIHSGLETALISTDQKFLDQLNRGDHQTMYGILLLPNNVSANQFSTLRQAKGLGGVFKSIGTGPP